MNDKKEYIDVLKALDRSGTLSTALNSLSAVQLATEDVSLARGLSIVTQLVRTQVRTKGNVRLFSLSAPQFPDLTTKLRQLAEYCVACRDAAEPQWQILAKHAGWTPPPEA
jgi:hypothetical protein